MVGHIKHRALQTGLTRTSQTNLCTCVRRHGGALYPHIHMQYSSSVSRSSSSAAAQPAVCHKTKKLMTFFHCRNKLSAGGMGAAPYPKELPLILRSSRQHLLSIPLPGAQKAVSVKVLYYPVIDRITVDQCTWQWKSILKLNHTNFYTLSSLCMHMRLRTCMCLRTELWNSHRQRLKRS